MGNLLQKAFGIYPGEDKNVLRFISLALLWAFGSSIAETLAISMFVDKVGSDKLPLVYLLTAFVLIGCSFLFLYSLKKTSPNQILSYIIKFAAISYAVFTLIMLFHPGKWFWYLLQISTYTFVAALIASYWTFLDGYHDLQDAKRIYGVYNASYFLGYVLSGSLINLVFDKVGLIPLFTLVSILMFFAYLQIQRITRSVKSVEDDSMEGILVSGKRGLKTLLRIFISSRYTVFLVFMSLFIQLIRTTTEFSYMDTFEKIFDPALSTPKNPITENTIAELLGKIKAFNAISNIILGTFIYHRCIRKFGVANLLLVPPIVFAFLYSEWVIQSTLLIAIMAVVAVEGFLFTVEDNNFNLLIKAAPAKLRGGLRFINDSFFEPIGLMFSSIFLFFFKSQHLWLGFTLALILLSISFLLRYLYPKSILQNLKANAMHFGRRINDWINFLPKKEQKEINEDIFEALKSDSEKMQLLAFETLLELQNQKILPHLLPYAEKFSQEGKSKVLEYFEKTDFSNSPLIIEALYSWLNLNFSLKLQKKIQLYLAKRGLLHPEKVEHLLESVDLTNKAIAITTLKNSKAQQSPEIAALNRTIAKKETDLLLASSQIEEKALGLNLISADFSDSIEKVIKYLEDEQIQIALAASLALLKFSSKVLSPYAFLIIERIDEVSDSQFRINCLKALGIISDSSTIKEIIKKSIFFRPAEKRLTETIITKMGLKTVPNLLSFVKDTNLHDHSRILASKILGRIALPQLQANLNEILEIEIKRAYFYLYFGHNIQKEYPLYDLSLLENALLTGLQSIVSFIIHLLGAAGSLEDCDLLVHSLHSKNAKDQADAVETLEKNCDRKIYKRIQPLIDEWPLKEVFSTYEKYYGSFPDLSLRELLNKLDNSASLFDKTIASYLKTKLRMPNWKESLRKQIKTSDGALHQYAYELLESTQ